MKTLQPRALTRERFAPYGDVIETAARTPCRMNDGRFDRFEGLSRVETDDRGHASIGIAKCTMPTTLPCRFTQIERHPMGSQAFIPLAAFPFVVVVAPPRPRVRVRDLRAFVTDGRQGVNYHRGTWHMPLIGLEVGQEFLVVDRVGAAPNWQGHVFDEPVTLGDCLASRMEGSNGSLTVRNGT